MVGRQEDVPVRRPEHVRPRDPAAVVATARRSPPGGASGSAARGCGARSGPVVPRGSAGRTACCGRGRGCGSSRSRRGRRRPGRAGTARPASRYGVSYASTGARRHGVDHRPHRDVAAGVGQPLVDLVEGQRVAVLGPDQPVAGAQARSRVRCRCSTTRGRARRRSAAERAPASPTIQAPVARLLVRVVRGLVADRLLLARGVSVSRCAGRAARAPGRAGRGPRPPSPAGRRRARCRPRAAGPRRSGPPPP